MSPRQFSEQLPPFGICRIELMNKRQPQKTPSATSAKRTKPATPIPAPPTVTAKESRARQKEWDHLLAVARQTCVEQWSFCRENPYDADAFIAYEKAVDAYWEAFQIADIERYARELPRRIEIEAAYPRGFAQAAEQLRRGDVHALELPVRFLEMDTWVYGSGYTKELLIRYINRLELPQEYVRRLQKVVLSVVDKADGRREFRAYCRLARKVDSPEFRQELESRLTVFPSRTGWRTQWALNACRKK